jgi:putative peptidoglycan lipid II flippase
MNRLLSKANQRVTLGSAAALLAGTALLGQVLGFFRLRIVLANFLHVADPAKSSDIFFAAFKIPDLVYFTLTAGALGVAFMPFLSDRLEKGDRKGMWDLTSSLINLLAIVMGALAVIILVFAEPLVHLVAPNMTPDQVHNAALLMRQRFSKNQDYNRQRAHYYCQ